MNSKSSAIVFDMQKRNFYSLTPLIATIDEDEKLRNYDLLLFESIDSKLLKSLLKKYKRLIVAFSFRTTQLSEIYKRMKIIYSSLSSEDLQKIIFIAGGSHPTGDPITTLRIGFDFTFIGEAEYSLPLFLKNLENEVEPKNTPGIAFMMNDNELVKTPRPPAIDLDNYPFLSKTRKLFPPLEISRGCAFGCTFCQVPMLFEHRVRHRSPDIIINTVKWMATKKLNDIRFITPNSFGYLSKKPKEVNREAIVNLLNSLKSIEGIRSVYFGTFPGEVRPETVSEDLMKDIKPYIANRRISIGLQSGSNKVLKDIRRGHTVEEALDAIDILLKTGFVPIEDMIIGLPGATLEDELLSIRVIENLIEKKSIIRAHVFMPLPGTALEGSLYEPILPAIRKKLGRLSANGKIEGNWTQQTKYAKEAWKMTQNIKSVSPLVKSNNP